MPTTQRSLGMMSNNPNQSESNSNDAPEDRFVDALLTHKFTETTESMDARINRVLRAVESQNNRNYSIQKWQWWALPIAALLAISLLVMPTTSSASAVVRSAAKVASKSVDRQYQVVLMPKARHDGEQPPPILATLDVRDSQHMRITIHYQGGRTEIRGRDGETSWEQRPDGSAVIADHDLPWPRWVETPDGSLLVDSMAAMLEDLDDSYDIVKVDDAEACGQTGLLQIRASFPTSEPALTNTPNEKVRRNPAERIEMCIDPKTNEVIRLEMFFPSNDGPPPDGQRGPRTDGPRPDGPRLGGERGPPPDGERGPRPDGPRPDGPRPEGPRLGGERGPPRGGPLGPPQSISFERTDTKSFPSNWFNAPANAVEEIPPQ